MITGATPVYALLGHPLKASPSPRLHNGWFREHEIDGVYVALPTREAAQAIRAVRALHIAGANVTVPLKQGVLPHVDRLSAAAELAGAVNTLWWEGNVLVGHNTDGEGLVCALSAQGLDLQGLDVTVIGAGGAGRGIATALAGTAIATLRILNRTEARAHELARKLRPTFPRVSVHAGPIQEEGIASADLVIVSTLPDTAAVRALDLGAMRPSAWWCDIAYRTPEPLSSTEARRRGHRVLDGWGMLCWQAALAFECFTGLRPNPRIPCDVRP